MFLIFLMIAVFHFTVSHATTVFTSQEIRFNQTGPRVYRQKLGRTLPFKARDGFTIDFDIRCLTAEGFLELRFARIGSMTDSEQIRVWIDPRRLTVVTGKHDVILVTHSSVEHGIAIRQQPLMHHIHIAVTDSGCVIEGIGKKSADTRDCFLCFLEPGQGIWDASVEAQNYIATLTNINMDGNCVIQES